MAAYELLQPFYQNSVQLKCSTIAASTTLYRGNLAMQGAGGVSGVFTRAGYAAGGQNLLGFPRDTYENTTAGLLYRTSKMLFHRGCPFEADGHAGDLPDENQIGGTVSMYDASTVTKTPAAGDLLVILLEVRPGGKFLVQLP